MTSEQKRKTLRAALRRWAKQPEWAMQVRYELLPQKTAAKWHKRFNQKLGRLLRVWGLSRGWYRTRPWLSGLKHASGGGASRCLSGLMLRTRKAPAPPAPPFSVFCLRTRNMYPSW